MVNTVCSSRLCSDRKNLKEQIEILKSLGQAFVVICIKDIVFCNDKNVEQDLVFLI